MLVKVHAASANPLGWHRMRGAPFLARLDGGLRKPNNPRLGADVAGRVEAVGSSVTQFQPRDEVFGCVTGAFAEYACGPETAFYLRPFISGVGLCIRLLRALVGEKQDA